MPVFRAALVLALSLLAATLRAAPTTVSDIAAPAGTPSAEPFVSASADTLLLSWLEQVPGGSETALRFATYRAGRWSEPRTIARRSDFFVNWADFPSLVADGKGTLYAHWLQKSGSSSYAYDIWIVRSRDGGQTWSDPVLLNRDGKKAEHGFVTLAPLPGEGIGVTWLDGRRMVEGTEEGEMTLRYARVDGSGVMQGEVELDRRTCECCATAMTVANGRPVIAYRDRSAAEVRDIAVVRQTAAGWSKPKLLHADGWKIAGCPVNGPQLDARGNRVAAAWFTLADGKARVYVAFSDDAGASFTAPLAVDDGSPLGRVDVVMADADSAVVTWLEKSATGATVRARRVTRRGAAAASVVVGESTSTRAAGFVRAAVAGPDVYISWTEQSKSGKRVRVSRVRF